MIAINDNDELYIEKPTHSQNIIRFIKIDSGSSNFRSFHAETIENIIITIEFVYKEEVGIFYNCRGTLYLISLKKDFSEEHLLSCLNKFQRKTEFHYGAEHLKTLMFLDELSLLTIEDFLE